MAQLTKLLFIGLDAAEKDLMRKWADAGHLPNFKKLFQNASWGLTHNPPGLYVGAIWPSFYTGVSPAQHGRYCFSQLPTGSYELTKFSPSDVKVEPFWNQLSRAGKKVAVIDVPKTFPSQNLNGIHIVDWSTHDPEGPITAWPPSLASEVIEKFGENSLVDCNNIQRDAAGFARFREDTINRIKKKTELSIHLLKQGGWDAFLTVFSESHCAGHQCWHLHDPAHPLYDPAIARITGDIIQDVYIALDTAVGELLQHAGPETHTLVLASHGMGPLYDGSFLLDEMLEKLEMPGQNNPLVTSILEDVYQSRDSKKHPGLVTLLKWVRDRLPKGVGIRRILKKYTQAKMQERDTQAKARLKKRKCFAIPNNNTYGGIRINLVGREPSGVVHSGAEYDDFCRSLIKDLLSFTNVDTGGPLINQVLKTAELYQGKYRDHLPDLMVEWNRTDPISTVHCRKTGKIYGVDTNCRTGDHSAEGLFFAMGDSIQPGRIEQSVSVMDFAPTIASMLEVELCGVEGQSIFSRFGIR